jgi:hypothetical protein
MTAQDRRRGIRPDRQWDDALRRADQALYHAKHHGLNRLCVHEDELAPPLTPLSAAFVT